VSAFQSDAENPHIPKMALRGNGEKHLAKRRTQDLNFFLNNGSVLQAWNNLKGTRPKYQGCGGRGPQKKSKCTMKRGGQFIRDRATNTQLEFGKRNRVGRAFEEKRTLTTKAKTPITDYGQIDRPPREGVITYPPCGQFDAKRTIEERQYILWQFDGRGCKAEKYLCPFCSKQT